MPISFAIVFWKHGWGWGWVWGVVGGSLEGIGSDMSHGAVIRIGALVVSLAAALGALPLAVDSPMMRFKGAVIFSIIENTT